MKLPNCLPLFALYMFISMAHSLLPAVSLWYSGQLLNIVQRAVDSQNLDTKYVVKIAAGHLACRLGNSFLQVSRTTCRRHLDIHINTHFKAHIVHAHTRLDCPTFEDSAVQRQLEEHQGAFGFSSAAWEGLIGAITTLQSVLQVVTQFSVLVNLLRQQKDGILFALLTTIPIMIQYSGVNSSISQAYAAVCSDKNFVRMYGLRDLSTQPQHRKELVAGDLGPYIYKQFQSLQKLLGPYALSFRETRRLYISRKPGWMSSLFTLCSEIPKIVFAFRAVHSPEKLPVSLASLNVIQESVSSFTLMVYQIYREAESLSENLQSIKSLYKLDEIENRVRDGNTHFLENTLSLSDGIAIEFRNVSFKYPWADAYALRNVSFKIEKGRLCVIVGVNGSGKSTILKLLARLYDPTEGQIFLDGKDIQTLVLADLRRSIAVLFQDYTHFPLSIAENIGMGDPTHAFDEDQIRQAAQLGGATEVIEKLPEGFDTYLQRPREARDMFVNLPPEMDTLFGKKIQNSGVKSRRKADRSDDTGLSGGEMQRLALSRTFMRTLNPESHIGLLLFDEPSASLDPEAEHDLFDRLRKLRGSKTMVFSSHRFGNLTRHADLILYIKMSETIESGTHDELLAKGGGYAAMYNIQARAFM
ncbi:P-loop containing nucleoside triphosphate hydrolase protein [Sistotremastrum niveocremeum HHB9708]|uniref:p-loop containing nucleoside triphosphate hydrolase protein n=1 Tax=Sistotremastrum niveocremeum HHB9708 TaxID=1314777 RepID=A0A164R9P9_9AGAM|nr:P-loop containing nucleoside triphosphate hydrolase protein [Sistotremastrum niveocremeum HHB9708]